MEMILQSRKERWKLFAVVIEYVILTLFSTSMIYSKLHLILCHFIVLIACKVDGLLQYSWWIILSPLWILSLQLPIHISRIVLITSKGEGEEEDGQQHVRQLQTGYTTTLVILLIAEEILIVLWMEGVSQIQLFLIFIPLYLGSVLQLIKELCLYVTNPVNR